ncbi:pitrilysin family protein [Ancylomarina sp. 16SWW S1-10-2]|uniref:M16 family metallopeptidase n=1 Tax=Ancylomarina sp. 16SWW S1-10-2 TaxID=2499681 RepID=UPI00189E0D11|nr:pitrilysin family protein [Ancylomarina sp. 16SWW S1-10-2]
MKKLNKFLFILVAICMVTSVHAQVDRTKAPAAGPAPKVQLGDYDSFTLKNGLKVLVVENHKIPHVSFSLNLNIDPIVEGDKAGFSSFAGSLMGTGTTTRTDAQLAEEIDFIGADINTSAGGVSAGGLSRYKENIIELMADVTLNPSFPKAEFDKIVKQTLSGLESSKNDPKSIASNLRSRILYGKNHPYGDVMTEATVKNITLGDCENYYATYFKPNVAILAIVGDITTKEAKKLVKKYFGKWEKADVPTFKYDMPAKMIGKRVVLANRDAATQSLVQIINTFELKKGDPDVIPSRVMNSMLGSGFSGLLFKNLREDKAYTYGAYSSISSDKLVANFRTTSNVKSVVTDSALVQMVVEIDRIRDTKLTQDHLNMTKAAMAGDFARALESPSTIASFAMAIERDNLPADYYATYLEKLDKVTLDDVQAMAKKYIDPNNAVYLVVGDKKYKERLAKLSSKGVVEEYDYKGDIVKVDPNAIPEGLTANAVVESYINAIGGREKLESIKDMSVKGEMKMGPMVISVDQAYKNNDKFSMSMVMNGQVMQAIKYNGTSAKIVAQGHESVANAEQLKGFKMQAHMFAELDLEELGFTTKIVGAEMIDGKKAYKLEVDGVDGTTKYDFYSAATGLKLKTVAQQNGMSVTMIYDKYTDVEGLRFPFSTITKMGPQEMPLTITSLEINKNIKDELFN